MIISLLVFLGILAINHAIITNREEKYFRIIGLFETFIWGGLTYVMFI